jgi:hypothetical protein
LIKVSKTYGGEKIFYSKTVLPNTGYLHAEN